MIISSWIKDNYIEVFGAVTGIVYVLLEIRQKIWLWPVGIITSAVYILVFFNSKFYADMSLQVYYLVISCLGWYWWVSGSGLRAQGSGTGDRRMKEDTDRSATYESNPPEDEGVGAVVKEKYELPVTRLKSTTGIILLLVFIFLYYVMYLILSKLTDSPVPGWDSFITSLSIVATWMLARKIYEHWYLWIVVNSVSAVLFMTRGLYPTVILYIVYGLMSFSGLIVWKKSIRNDLPLNLKIK